MVVRYFFAAGACLAMMSSLIFMNDPG